MGAREAAGSAIAILGRLPEWTPFLGIHCYATMSNDLLGTRGQFTELMDAAPSNRLFDGGMSSQLASNGALLNASKPAQGPGRAKEKNIL